MKRVLKARENSHQKVIPFPKEGIRTDKGIKSLIRVWRTYFKKEELLKGLLALSVIIFLTFILSPETEPFRSEFLLKGEDFSPWMVRAGLFLISFLIIYIIYRDINRYKPSLTKDFGKLALLGILLIGTLLISKLFYFVLNAIAENLGFLGSPTIVFGMPVALGAMLVALLFDIHLAIVFSFTIGILSGIWVTSETLFPIYAFTGSIVASFSVIRCTQRSAILRAGFFVGLANIVTIMAIDLYNGTMFTYKAFLDSLFGIGNGFVMAIVVSGVLPIFESLFKITTDIKLLELLDLNQPLMRNLLVTAPGTYHHSIIVGNLSEAAAEAVSVNPLLARVSSYYHDIGKIKMPEYFIENQGSLNRHDKLTPSMSSLILTSHVKEGTELAKGENLPEVIIDIMKQHHGTSLITYFYQKAKDIWDPSMTPISEDDYRYPGPKPQTKVAAIVMLADAVEAASRVLEEPTPARISALVDKIVTNIFVDGQLNECDLTLKDLNKITENFNLILSGIFHHRIDYPGLGIPLYDTNKKSASEDQDKPAEDEKDNKADLKGIDLSL